MVAQGFAFGTGSSIARHAVDSVMGGGSTRHVEQPQVPQASIPQQSSFSTSTDVCEFDRNAFMSCLKENPSNANACDFYYNALQQCQSSNN
jgi:hypothetical protein